MPEKLVKIAAFETAHEAHLAKVLLDYEGIDSVINDENIVLTSWLYSRAVGGVKLLVKESDAGRAGDILKSDGERALSGDMPPDEPETSSDCREGEPRKYHEPNCPKCDSQNVTLEKRVPRLTVLGVLLIGIPFLFIRRRWRCEKCAHEWK